MSLTAHLLFGKPTRLPKGRVYTHNPDARRLAAITPAQQDNAARSTATRLANVERIFNAVADGVETILTIAVHTELTEVTVQKALHDLEDWPGGPRIVRIKGRHHKFHVAPTQPEKESP